MNIEMLANQIAEIIRKGLKDNIGKQPSLDELKKIISERYSRVLNEHPSLFGKSEVTLVKTMWESMPFKRKIKWLLYRCWPMRRTAKNYRRMIDDINCMRYKMYGDDYIPIKCPDYLELEPKSIMLISAAINPPIPVDNIMIKVLP